MRSTKLPCIATCCLLAISVTIIDVAGARADTLRLTIETRTDPDGATRYSVAAPGITHFSVGDLLEISCPGDDCTDLVVMHGEKPIKQKGKDPGSPWKSVALGDDGDRLFVSLGAWTLNPPITRKGAGSGATSGAAQGASGAGLFRPACPAEIADGQIAVDVTGNVIASRVARFTEDDVLTVWVFGAEDTLARVKVVRRSPLRDVTVLRIQGDPSRVTGGKKESGGEARLACKRVELAGFSAGRGQFAVIGDGEAVMAEYEFAVHPVYDGMFTVAFVGTWLPERAFSLRDDGAGSKIVADPSGDVEGRYALMYTAFLPLARWRGRGDLAWNQRVGVSAGVLLDDPAESFLVGVNLGPVGGLSLVAGGHVGKVSELDGVSVGDVLPADATVPTRNVWDIDWFVGMSLDIGVATRLFFSLLGPP